MKIVITQDQIKLIKESTNRSAKLLGKFYDIEGYHAYYLGDSMIQSRVRFTPKDFDNPMTPRYGESICNWKIDKPFSSVPGDVTFVAMNLPDPFNVPLMDHIGNTEELEEYLKELHMEEVEEFIKRIIHRRNNPLKESVELNEGKYDKIIERILNDSEVITDIEYRGRTHDRYSDGHIDEIIFWFEFPGRKRAQYRDMKFLTKNNQVLDIDFDSRFPNFNNLIDGFDTIPSNVLMEYFIEKGKEFLNQYLPSRFSNHINESVDKNKKFLTNVMGQDFTGKIKEVKDQYDVPMSFDDGVSPGLINLCLNHWGPMYLVDIDGKNYLYQDRSDDYEVYEWFHDENGFNYVNDEITEQLGISDMGLKFSNIIDTFYNQEGEPLNEEENDKPDWLRENTKVKNLLKKLFENKEYEFSFKDKWEDLDGHIETYTFHYHIEILNAIGVGSDTIARVQVIIDDIILDGESVYDGWVEIGYSNNVWYINNLENHLDEEFFDVFPFSIYVNFYGHDEEM
jgi:hypothetical protein